MFTLRTIASRSLQTKTRQKIIQSSFSTTATTTPTSSFSEEGTVETGKVKSYYDRKAYGFIISDVDSAELFVHRTSIVGAPSNDVFNPFLLKDERVQYKRVVKEGSKHVAKEVVFDNGDTIPVYRGKFRKMSASVAKAKLGYMVYDILTEGGDAEEMAQKIAEAYTEARNSIEQTEEDSDTSTKENPNES